MLRLPVSRKALDWLSMAEEDLSTSIEGLKAGRYASAVFYAELSAQKAVKALIVSLGYEPGKTHKLTAVLKGLILGGLVDLREELMEALNQTISFSIVLEDQGVAPRYGWETINRIIKPSEIYDEGKARALVANAEKVLELAKKIIGDVDC